MDKTLVCEFCNKQFKREVNFLKHRCETMKRYEVFSTLIGRVSYLLFNQWRKISGYPSVTVETFVGSRYFNAFQKFAQFSKSQNIPDKIGYIELMVSKGLMPFHWCDLDVYDFYVEHFDKEYTIDEKVNVSIETIREISKNNDCETSDVFEKITPIQALRYITARKLSPWLLLSSRKFMEFMTYRSTKEERLLFSSFVNVAEWKKYFLNNQEKVTEIKNINRQLGI
jgi:hypothetical protein